MRNRTEDKIRTEMELDLSFIRHGLTTSNMEYRYLGKTDEELAEAGIKELKEKKRQGAYTIPEIIFSSPMLRCRQTAEILFPDRKYCFIPEWTEIDFGLFEGKNRFDLNEDRKYQEWIDSNGTLPFPGGERREDYIARVMRGFDRMLGLWEECCKETDYADNKAVLKATVIVHGGTIMALCSRLFGGDYFDYQVKCGEGFECRFKYMGNYQAEAVEIKNI